MRAYAIKERPYLAEQDSVSVIKEDAARHPELHQAALDNIAQDIRMLVKAGKNPNERNTNGSTPLHFAAARNNIEAIRTLLALGADPLITNKAGLTATEIGLFMGNIGSWYEA